MENKEMVAALKRIRDVQPPFSVAWTALDSIVAELEARALEAKPVVEGWVSTWVQDMAPNWSPFLVNREQRPGTDCPVTVTITERKVEP